MTKQLPQRFQDQLTALGEDRRRELLASFEFCDWLAHNPVFGDSYVFTYASGNWLEIVCHGPDVCFADAYFHER